MVTILLEKILTLLTGWLSAFTEHATNVLAKLNLIEEDTSNLPDIKTNTDSIVSNTASVITPINNIKSNTDSIKTNTDSIKNDTAVIKNNINTISTNTGTASAFCEDIANNTLDIDNRVVTIGSDTTQLRTNSNAMATDLHDIKQSLQYYFLTNIVTEDSEGSIANFDTDLQDYLQKAVVTIPSDVNGISGLDIVNCKKNIFDIAYLTAQDITISGNIVSGKANKFSSAFSAGIANLRFKPNTRYSFRFKYKCDNEQGTTGNGLYLGVRYSDNSVGYMWCLNNQMSYIDVSYVSIAGKSITSLFISYGGGSLNTFYLKDIQIEENSNVTDYEEFNGNTNSITFTSPITDGAEVDLLSGIVKINTSPVTYDSITPIAIRSFKGVNNVYSDIGDMSVTYRETLKHYLDKQNQ